MRPGTAAWRADRVGALLDFARGSVRERGGFGWLDDAGHVDAARPLELWINARMTYVFAQAHAAGWDGAGDVAEHGVRALDTLFRDREHGGWFAEVAADGSRRRGAKTCYEHAFVALAAAAAAAAGVDGAPGLLADALDMHERRFWDESVGACVEEWDRAWTVLDGYRGANSNMHTVEAYLAAAHTTGDEVWLRRALRIAERLVDGHARRHGWRLPEHYDDHWRALPEHNAERPDDPFRPYGATPGHALEWSRLLLQLAARTTEPWLAGAAQSLFDRAVADAVDASAPGIPYTTGWDGRPVVAERFHWVMAEAVQAAAAVHRATAREAYAALEDRWWAEIDTWFIDPTNGSWRHELSPTMGPSARTWRGRPDAYHAWNALTSRSD